MQVVKSIPQFELLRAGLNNHRVRVSLVPTMGALHRGHLSLVHRAKQLSDHVVVSIFVNPAQFGPTEDLSEYPRTEERDLDLLDQAGVATVLMPEIVDIYPDGFRTYVIVEELSEKLCGASRPGHFRGVATVVLKLLNIVRPNLAVFGQKDAQQCLIVRRMVKDLNLGVEITVCPIVREPDGLALSSRNRYLNARERGAATILYRCLKWAEHQVADGETCSEPILRGIRDQVAQEPLARLDYADIVDRDNLSSLSRLRPSGLLALAAYIGKARLIDNTVLSSQEPVLG